MKIGYARVSTHEQNLDLQIDDLKKEGCEKIFCDKVSGTKDDRPEMNEMLKQLRKGDTVVIWRLDRLGRSVKHLTSLSESFKAQGIELKSLKESIDTNTSTGKLMFHIFAAIAEFERNIISERTLAGLAAQKARGIKLGRIKALPKKQRELARHLYNERNEDGSQKHSVNFIAESLGISRATLYRYLKEE